MSVLKTLSRKRFWVAVGLALMIGLLVNAAGAALVIWGVAAAEKTWYVNCVGWFLGVFCASRYTVKGEGGALLEGLMVFCFSFGTAFLVGRFLALGQLPEHWWASVVAALSGALTSSVMRPGKKKRRRAGKVTSRKKLR